MNYKTDFKNIYSVYVKNTIKKSLFNSLFISFTCLFIISFIFWFFGIKEYWIAFVAFGVLELITFTIFYLLNKPTEIKFAKELDSLGLEQRVITMYEYQNDNSLIAEIQRQNAIDHINKFDVKLLKVVIPVLMLTLMISICVLGVASSTASVLSAKGIIKSGKKVVSNIVPAETNVYNIYYSAKKGGSISGELTQTVEEGSSCTPVIAVPFHGFIFVSWSDGSHDPYRLDSNVNKDLDLFATFISIDEYTELIKDPGEPEIPEEPGNGGMQMPKPGGDDGNSPKRYEENSQIIDGETFYGESVFDQYQQDMIELLAIDTDLSSDTKKIINDYFDTIEK